MMNGLKIWVAAGKATRLRLLQTRDLMNQVLPQADVRGYEQLVATLSLPDPDDRHVLAAAIQAKAACIVTFNIRDFPAEVLSRIGIIAVDPDRFLTRLFKADPDGITDAVNAARLNLTRTAPPPGTFLETLERQGLVRFAKACQARITNTPGATNQHIEK